VNSHAGWLVLAGVLVAGGIALAVASRVNPNDVPGWWSPGSVVLVAVGGLIFVYVLLFRPLFLWMGRRLGWYGAARRQRLLKAAVYRQALECVPNGHRFEEEVRQTSQGWLAAEGARRRCPICGEEATGFRSHGFTPLNRTARKVGNP
jgi:hypothetical protein